ncbi:MAG: Hpt domain-containing protein [Campylobacterales bacterium]|nr:Hpt domain-containing protein [Campylobacterales bacterium]
MYYLLNSSGEIVAASNDFLSFLNVKSLIELYKKIDKDKIELTINRDTLLIKTQDDHITKTIKQSDIVTSSGSLKLIIIDDGGSSSSSVDTGIVYNNDSDDLEMLELEDLYKEIDEPKIEAKTTPEPQSNDDFLYNLTHDEFKELPKYIVDIDKNSSLLGVDKEDYKEFISEYKETLHSLVDDLLSSNEAKRDQAVKIAKHLTQNLHLPKELIDSCETITKSDTKEGVEEFYALVDNLELVESGGGLSIAEDAPLDIIEDSYQEDEEKFELEDKKVELIGGETINLSDVVAARFDFSVDEAAKELNLPNELVKEFIKDFIDQMHTETTNLIKAYEIGDLPRIQKIAHMLKGTASNLRIAPLAESLAALQANDKLENVESMVKKYWAQFLSFKRQMADTLQ